MKSRKEIAIPALRLLNQLKSCRQGILVFASTENIYRAFRLISESTLPFVNLFILIGEWRKEITKLAKRLSKIPKVQLVTEDKIKSQLAGETWLFDFLSDEPIVSKSSRHYSIAMEKDLEERCHDQRRLFVYSDDGCCNSRVQVYLTYWHSSKKYKRRHEDFDNPLDAKRSVVWKNYSRTLWIAFLCRLLTCKRFSKLSWKEALRAQGIYFDSSLIERSKPRVMVLVESTEHAIEIQMLLSNWHIRSLCNDAIVNKPNGTKLEICTLAYTMNHEVDADIVIRATGHHGELPALLTDHRNRDLMIIDIADRRSPWERAALQMRLADYHMKRYQIIYAARRSQELIPGLTESFPGGAAR